MRPRLLEEGAGAVGGSLRQGGQAGKGEGGLGVALPGEQGEADPELRLVGLAGGEGVPLAGGALEQGQGAVGLVVPLEGDAHQHRHPAVLGFGDQPQEPLGGPEGGGVAGILLEQAHQQAAGELGVAAAQGALAARQLDLPPLRAGQGLRPQAAQQLAVPPLAERVDEQADRLRDQRRAGIAGDHGRHQAGRHLGVPHPVVVERQAVAAVGLERRVGRQGAHEGVARLPEPAEGVEKVAAQVVEPEPP